MRGRAVLVAAMAWSAACGRPAAGPATASGERRAARENQPAGRGASEGVGTRVEIIQAGRAPRRALRYRVRPDHLGVTTAVFDMDIAYRTGDGPLIRTPSPPMVMDMEATALTVSGGVARETFRVTRFDVTTSPSDATDEKTRETVRQNLAPMVGMTGWMEIDDRGRLRGMGYDYPASLPAASRAVMEGMSKSGEEMVVPLPEEPVGVGAEWYVARDSPFMGMRMANNTRVALLAMDGDRVTLRYSIEMAAGNQPFAFPGLPAGTTAELMSCDGSGDAEIELDLGWPSPARMRMSSQTQMSVEVTSGGPTQRIEVQARMSMELERR